MDIEEWLGNEPQIRVKKESPPYYLLVHEQMDTDEFVASLRNQAGFESVEPNYIYTKQTTGAVQEPNDEFYQPYQWNLSQIQVKEGWEISSGSEEVIIAVLDTGVDLKHQDIAEKMVEGFNAFDGSSDPTDEHGHGTHVAGISSAITNNVKGIAGVSWRNRIMPIKVLDEKGEGSLFEITSGIRWATDHGAKVINMSLGDTENSPMLYDAIRYAYEHDVMLIAAAGNDNVSQMMYPAGYEEVLAVSAVNPDKTKAEFSNYGSHIDVAAPGESIPSLFPDNHYVYMSGTSMAAPHVSGMAGLIRSVRPDLSNEEVMNLIRHTAEDLGDEGHDSYFGYGLINVAKALEYVQAHREVAFANAERTRELEEPWYLYFFRELFNR
ncbi:S8 family peptidase [Caldalkalibacillus mannanilyticus]|uniref:S8 family peptidase n=1 Tax=Caldalkalibacillus mannanilyticus TaxID=1418 RepID=UPI0009DFC6A8|nr:S8 family peptidase [Caldalkalibacillus mannanilyticus]